MHPLNVLIKPTKVFPFMFINKMEAPSHLADIQTVWSSLNVSVNSGDKIYVAVAHDYDGDTATGRVSVRHG